MSSLTKNWSIYFVLFYQLLLNKINQGLSRFVLKDSNVLSFMKNNLLIYVLPMCFVITCIRLTNKL